MSAQSTPAATTSQQGTQSERHATPTPPGPAAIASHDSATAPPVSPAQRLDGGKRPVIDITDSPLRASTGTPLKLAPSGQRPLPPFQQPTRYAQPLAPAPPHASRPQGPQAPSNPHYGQPVAWPQLMDRCPRCNFVAGQPWYAPPSQPQQQPHGQQAPPGYPLPTFPQQNRAEQTHHGYAVGSEPPPPQHPNAHLYVPNPAYNPPLPSTQPAKPPEISPWNPPSPKVPPSFIGYGVAANTVPTREAVVEADGSVRYRSRRESKRVKNRRLTRDERRDILLMRRLGYSYEVIAKFLGATIAAVAYTCRQNSADTKHHNAGRRANQLPPEIMDKLVTYVERYLAKERAAGVDKKTGRRKMTPLTYAMIRDAVFNDENGNIPPELKLTDDALKAVLNKKGLWLRRPYSKAKKEEARARGKKQWLDKCAREAAEKARAEAAARGQIITDDQLAAARDHGAREGEESHGCVEAEADAVAEAEAEDDEMHEYSGTESIPDEDEEGDVDHGEDMEIQLRRAIQIHPLQNR